MFNEQILIGNVGNDAELRVLPSGTQVANFSMATNYSFQRNDGEWIQETEWFKVAVWGNPAPRIAERFKKGTSVFVIGRLSTEQFSDKKGINRTNLKINASRAIALPKGVCANCGFNPNQNQNNGQGQAQGQGHAHQAAPQQSQSPAVYNQNQGYDNQSGAPASAPTTPQPQQEQYPPEDLEDLPW